MEPFLALFAAIDPGFCLRLGLITAIGLALTFLASYAAGAVSRRVGLGPLAVRPVKWTARWIGLVVVAAALAREFGVDLYGILAAVLAMVAIGFVAVWSVMSNVSCTLLLIVFKPFRILDEIEFPGEPVKGRVVDLSLLHTTLKASNGATYHIPNNLFFQKVVLRHPGTDAGVELEEQLRREQPAA